MAHDKNRKRSGTKRSRDMKSIIIIIDYFGGEWPEWFPLYLESCRHNPTIDWLIHTDCDCDAFKNKRFKNVRFRKMTMQEYIENVNKKLGIKFSPANAYKLCDLKPARGALYDEEIRGYDFFGYGDIDLLYGDIRKFYTDNILKKNNMTSTGDLFLTGHLSLMRNVPWVRDAFKRVRGWKRIFEKGEYQRFDEVLFTPVVTYPSYLPKMLRRQYDLLDRRGSRYRKKVHLKEYYTTPLVGYIKWIDGTYNHPEVWFWRRGHVTNDKDKDTEFIYIHFMNYKYPRCLDRKYGKKAFWDGMKSVMHIKPKDIGCDVRIDRTGFHKA